MDDDIIALGDSTLSAAAHRWVELKKIEFIPEKQKVGAPHQAPQPLRPSLKDKPSKEALKTNRL